MADMPQERVDELADLFRSSLNRLNFESYFRDMGSLLAEGAGILKAAVDLIKQHPTLASRGVILYPGTDSSLYPIFCLAHFGACLEDVRTVYELYPQALNPSGWGVNDNGETLNHMELFASREVAEIDVMSFFIDKCPQFITSLTDEECDNVLERLFGRGERVLKEPEEALVYAGDNKRVQQLEFEKLVLKMLDLMPPTLDGFTLSRAANSGMPETIINKILEQSDDSIVDYPRASYNALLREYSARRVINVLPRIEEFKLNQYDRGVDDPSTLVSILETVASALEGNLKRASLCLACDVLATSSLVRNALAELFMKTCENLEHISFDFSRTCYYWHRKEILEQKGFYSEDKTLEAIAKAIASRKTAFPGLLRFQGFHLTDFNLLAPIFASLNCARKLAFSNCSFDGEMMLKSLDSCREAESRQDIESLSIHDCRMSSNTLRSLSKFLAQEANLKSFLLKIDNMDTAETAPTACDIKTFVGAHSQLQELTLEDIPDEWVPAVLEVLRDGSSCVKSLKISVRDKDEVDNDDDNVGHDASDGADEGVRKDRNGGTEDDVPNVVREILCLLSHNVTLEHCSIKEPFSQSDHMVNGRTKEAKKARRLCQRKMKYYLDLNELGRKEARDSRGTTTVSMFVDLLANVLCECEYGIEDVNGEDSDDDSRIFTFGNEDSLSYDESVVSYLYGLLQEKPSLWTTNIGDSSTAADARDTLNGNIDDANGCPSFYERESKRARLSS